MIRTETPEIHIVERWQCPYCGRLYKTAEEAAACNSGYIPRIGDIIKKGWNLMVVGPENDDEELFDRGSLWLKPLKDLFIATGRPLDVMKDTGGVFIQWRKMFCNHEYSIGKPDARKAGTEEIAEMEKIIAECRKRIAAAERIKAAIQKQGEQS